MTDEEIAVAIGDKINGIEAAVSAIGELANADFRSRLPEPYRGIAETALADLDAAAKAFHSASAELRQLAR